MVDKTEQKTGNLPPRKEATGELEFSLNKWRLIFAEAFKHWHEKLGMKGEQIKKIKDEPASNLDAKKSDIIFVLAAKNLLFYPPNPNLFPEGQNYTISQLFEFPKKKITRGKKLQTKKDRDNAILFLGTYLPPYYGNNIGMHFSTLARLENLRFQPSFEVPASLEVTEMRVPRPAFITGVLKEIQSVS